MARMFRRDFTVAIFDHVFIRKNGRTLKFAYVVDEDFRTIAIKRGSKKQVARRLAAARAVIEEMSEGTWPSVRKDNHE